MDTSFLHKVHMPSTLRQLFLHARRANVRGVHILHHRVFGIPTKHLVAHRPDLSWIVRDCIRAALATASRGTPMRRLASTASQYERSHQVAVRRLRTRRPFAATARGLRH